MKREDLVDEFLQRHLRLHADRKLHNILDIYRTRSFDVAENRFCRIVQKQTGEHCPEPREEFAVDDNEQYPEHDQADRDHLPASAGKDRRLGQIFSILPKIGAKHAPAIERISRKHVEDREKEIRQREKEEKYPEYVERAGIRCRHQDEKKKCENEARRRPRDSNSKLRARRLRRMSKTRQPAERVEHDLDHLELLPPRRDRMRKLVKKYRSEKYERRRDPQNDAPCNIPNQR